MSSFRFQQFSVLQKNSAMKLCTDTVLFGAMAPIDQGDHVLDIGAGTGVLSLMAAQRGAEKVTAVELTQEAYAEALINFKNSPWPERLEAVHRDIQSFAPTARHSYDLIISNPPFFENHSQAQDKLRNIARHTEQLPYADLIRAAKRLLSQKGLFYCLIPSHAIDKFCAISFANGFYLNHQCDIQAYQHQKAKVAALTFGCVQTTFNKSILTVYESPGVYSPKSQTYLKDFLLRFAE